MNKYIFIFLFTIVSGFLISCKSTAEQEIADRDAYLQENNITVAPTASGLYYIETLEGTGATPLRGDKVEVNYTGKLLDGTVFDSSYDRNEPLEFTLGAGQVISGWEEGIALMKQGGKATMIIPSNLAYGPYGRSTIPPYSTLVFEVELVKVSKM